MTINQGDEWQVREIQRARLAEIDNFGQPWVNNSALWSSLELAGFRYAALIGISDAPEGYEKQCADDREKYKHFIKRYDGLPSWDEKDAVMFVCDLTGVSSEVAVAWLDYDWPLPSFTGE